MADKIFYSWQSDRPDKTNRSFIEDALKKAIQNLGQAEDEFYESPRQEIELDKDTKGMAGSPPIVDTIFKKIEECAVFVPDLTFCGTTEKGRPIPNPNVLIEYGWALAKLGYGKIVGVMNSVYGRPTEQTVPFNIRHTRWPHDFSLEETEEDRQAIKRDLIRFFEDSIRTVLEASPTVHPSFTPMQPKSRASSFLDAGDVLGILPAGSGLQEDTKVVWHDGPQLFLRVIPDVPVGPYTPLGIKEMLERQPLLPFRSLDGKRLGNEWGMALFWPGGTDQTSPDPDYIVQVTRQGEIWGIDNYYLQPERIVNEAETAKSMGFYNHHPQENVVPFLEDEYASALTQYLQFAREQLKVTSTVTVIAGLTDVQGFQICLPYPHTSFSGRVGRAASANIVSSIRGVPLQPNGETEMECYEGYVLDEDVCFRHAYKTLIPFYKNVWGEFQYPRPSFLPK